MVDSENARLGREVAERTHELNELTNYLQWTAEREKATIARDLHDELGGILTSAKMDIEWLGARHRQDAGEREAAGTAQSSRR